MHIHMHLSFMFWIIFDSMCHTIEQILIWKRKKKLSKPGEDKGTADKEMKQIILRIT
jgi:hypothetical protein